MSLRALFGLGSALLFVGSIVAETSEAAERSRPSWAKRPSWAAPAGRSTGKSFNSRMGVAPFTPGSHNIALDLGQVFLVDSKYSDNIGFRAHYTYGVSDIFGFDTALGISDHSDGAFSVTSLLTGIRVNFTWYDRIIPYGVGGLGFFRPSYDVNGQTVAPVLFGLHAGVGANLQLTNKFFFGAAMNINHMFSSKKTLEDGSKFDVGGLFASFFLNAGVTF